MTRTRSDGAEGEGVDVDVAHGHTAPSEQSPRRSSVGAAVNVSDEKACRKDPDWKDDLRRGR